MSVEKDVTEGGITQPAAGAVELSVGAVTTAPREVFTAKVAAVEGPAPVTTITDALAARASCETPTIAINSVGLTYVVGKALPAHCTTLEESKPEPKTTNGKLPPPAKALVGLKLEMAGTPHCVVRAPANWKASMEPRPVTVSYPGPAEYPSLPEAGQSGDAATQGRILSPAVISWNAAGVVWAMAYRLGLIFPWPSWVCSPLAS